ncbi:MAG TPA: heme-degrading domain-containing protein [Acidobacteriaceae bacterium]|nr:heme-degrading domain-containing protein [Acidobacteriaceae bacterium]
MTEMTTMDKIAQIGEQEKALVLKRFDEKDAWTLGTWLQAAAAERGYGVVIDVRRVGQQLFYAAMPGTTPDNPEWVRRKSNVALRFHRSSYAIGLEMQEKQSNLTERYGLPLADYATHGGSVPIRVEGVGVVAAVTVSGLPQHEDHELVIEALCAMAKVDYASLRLS